MDDSGTPRFAASVGAAKSSKPSTTPSKPAPPRYSKDWFNQQLGRPYVLYPLCVVIILGALFVTFGNPFGSSTPSPAAKQQAKTVETKPAVPALIPVAFNVQPDAKDLEVTADGTPVPAMPDGKYAFPAGRHSLTLAKAGFTPVKRDIDVSPTSNTFDVKFEPIIKYVNVVVQVTPPNAVLKVAGAKQKLVNGSYTHKLQEGKPLQVEASLDKYVSVSRKFSADELETLSNKVTIELEREKPRLPGSLLAKPEAAIDPKTQLPTRVLAARLGDDEPLELALVKPGKYTFGVPDDKRRPGELTQRSVLIDHPFYIAIHETTNAQYQKFFDAVGEAMAGTRWQAASRKWAGPQKLDPIKNQLPVANLSIDQAQAFCNWMGGQLPSEIEWECAVRGTDDKGFPYPWGTAEVTRDRCRIFYGEHLERGEGGPVPVDQMASGVNPLGLTHALGNVAEWCGDSQNRGAFILRGCSITTANINDVRVTWRARGDAGGEESTGFRVIVPITDTAIDHPSKTTEVEQPTLVASKQPSSRGGFMSSFTWDKVVNALTSPSSGSDGAAGNSSNKR